MRKCALIVALLGSILPLTSLRAALIPPFFISSVVAIGSHEPSQQPGGIGEPWFTEGTGFFYGYLVHDDKDPTKKKYAVYLVTAAHVLKDHPETCRQATIEELARCQTTVLVRLDATETSGAAREFEVPVSQWFYHEDSTVDLAATPISINFLRDNGLQSSFFTSDDSSATKSQLQEFGASAGDGVFILGFPMNLAGEQKNYVIARQGAIARISEMLEGASTTFLVDSFVFPGNSGGPVVVRPEVVSIEGTKSIPRAMLIGVVLAYQSYIDVAFSAQSKRPRVSFEENSGLAIVLPMDKVNEMLKDRAKALWDTESATSTAAPTTTPAH